VSVAGGTPQRVGTTADGALFEELFLDGLEGPQTARLAR